MELEKGYKQTEVGIIPKDWDLVSYNEAFSFHSTASYPREMLSENGNVFYVHYGDIHTKWKNFLDFDKNTLPTITNAQAKGFHLLEEGDIIIVDASEDYEGVGTSVEIKNIGTKKAISGLHTFLLKTKNEVFINGIKGYIHNNRIVKKQFDKLATGLKVYGVSRGNLKKVLIPTPPTKQEQTAIAQVLSDTDELISSLEKLIEKKKLIKLGTMQQLLTGKKRLTMFSGEWEIRKLKDLIFSFQNGFGFSAKEYVDSGVPIITMAQIGLDGTFQFDEANINFWPDRYLNSLKDFHVKKNDVIIAMTDVTPEKNLIGRMTQVNMDRIFLLNQRVGLLRIDPEKVHPIFLISLSNQREWRNYSIAVASLGVQANISTKDILNGEMKIPEIDEQIAIAQILSDMEFEIKSLEQKLNKYKSIKQGMMQNLLTGKIRLV